MDYWTPRQDPDGVLRTRCTDEERDWYLEGVAEEINYAKRLDAYSVVDFGAGPGWFLDELNCRQKVAVETSGRARGQLHAKGIEVVSVLESLASSEFQLVIANHVIEHLRDPIDAIQQIHRILIPGGDLIIGTPDFGSPCAQRFGANYRMLHDETHCSLFTLESMHRFLRDHGFRILDVRFPFPDRYATAENFARWHDTSKVSPPWPGNWMTFYCQR